MRRVKNILITLVSLLAVLAPMAARAEQRGLTITPPTIDLVVQPGELYTGKFQVLNQGQTDYDFKIYPSPYRVEDEDYTPDFTYLPGNTQVNDWFQFTLLHDHIKPNEVKDIGYRIVVPRGTAPGGYYAVAFAETQYPPTTDKIVLNHRLGVIFYLQVAGPIDTSYKVASWKANFLQRSPLTAELRMQNNGSSHYVAKVSMKVQDVFGHTKYTFDTSKYVLPRTIRKFTMNWDKAPSIGLFKVTGVVDALGQKTNLPARYVLVLSDRARQILLAVGIVLMVIGALRLLWYMRTHKKKKKAKREKTTSPD